MWMAKLWCRFFPYSCQWYIIKKSWSLTTGLLYEEVTIIYLALPCYASLHLWIMLSNSLASSRDLVTPSPPPEESSHDEFTPERPSKSVVSEFISPSTRSNTTANLPSYVRIAINNLYRKIYGEDPLRCLVTRSKLSLIMSHIVQRASKPCLVSHDICCLSFAHFPLSWHAMNTV